MRNKIVLPVLGAALMAGTVLAPARMYASERGTPTSSVVQRIAQRFGLNEADVKAVFDEEKEDKHARMQARYEQRLNKYVSEGLISETQKQLILDKQDEMEADRQARIQEGQSFTPEEEHTYRQNQRQELRNWAKEQGIELKYLFPYGRGKWSKVSVSRVTPTVTPVAQ